MSNVTQLLSAIESGDPKAAQLLGLPERTAKRTWAYAWAWLSEEQKKSL